MNESRLSRKVGPAFVCNDGNDDENSKEVLKMIRLSRSPVEAVVVGREVAKKYRIPLKVAIRILDNYGEDKVDEQLRKAMILWMQVKKEGDVQ